MYQQVLEEKKFITKKIFNADETGVSSVHKPPEIIAQKGVKQISGVTFAERGFNTTMNP